MMGKKQYVTVKAVHRPDGTCVPWAIGLEDHSEYRIDRILEMTRSYAETGGRGIRYTVRIGKSVSYLFDEQNGRWFVEEKVS